MRWVICLISLIAFATQQVLCCCSGALTFQHEHSTAISSAEANPHQHIGCCGHHTHSDTSDDHSQKSPDGDADSSPHQHHLCVGTHLFYRIVDLTVAPDPLLSGSTLAIADLLTPQLHEPRSLYSDHGLPDIRHPSREVLGIFLL